MLRAKKRIVLGRKPLIPQEGCDSDFYGHVEFCKERLAKEPAAENLLTQVAKATPTEFAQKILELSDQQCDYLDQFARIILLQKGRKFCAKIFKQLEQQADEKQVDNLIKIFTEQIFLIVSSNRKNLYGITDEQYNNFVKS